MANKIVIVESVAKARTIGGYLGKGYNVKPSRGHVRDLPEDDFGVDVEKDFEPVYRVMPGSRRTVGQLRKLTKDAAEVYLAPDPDREGEAIAWHLQHVLGLPDEKVKRVTFNEVTSQAVRLAFTQPRRIDMDLVNAQQARRILDRIVGYELSPLISSKVVRGLSAGRVQSVALRLIVDRERERLAFDPEEYWEIKAALCVAGGNGRFEAELAKMDGRKVKMPAKAEADAVLERLAGADYAVASVEKRSTSSKAPPPFITSTLQQAANTRLGFTGARTMRLAQQLYEGLEMGRESAGLITYMRTDSTRVAPGALENCRRFITENYGKGYVPAKPNVFRSPRGAQAAHEAIRPTSVRRRPEDVRQYLDAAQFKLYDLIWRRFVASQMKPARYDVTTVEVKAGPAIFVAKGRVMTFDGYTRVAGAKDSDDQELPSLAEGDALDLVELVPSQHFTKPPPRYTEASLVRTLEKEGIGRPSTYAPTVSTLLRRNYVRRSRRALQPTDLGMVVTDLLVEHFPRELDLSFTSRLEDELDEIEEGKRDWRATLREFYETFSQEMTRARLEMKSVRDLPPDDEEKCPECGEPLAVQFSRRGDKFIGCRGFPKCRYTRSLPRPGDQDPVETEHRCDKCGAPMVRRTGRRGREFLGCSAFPKCRNVMGLDREGKPVKMEQRVGTGLSCPHCGGDMHVSEEGDARELTCTRCRRTVPLLSVQDALAATEIGEDQDLGPCEECGKPMTVKRSRKGLFMGCSSYPECKNTAPMPKDKLPAPQPTFERCDKCGRPLVVRWGKFGRFLACSGFPRCRNKWAITGRRRRCKADGCGARMMKKVDKDGNPYLGCTRYPECSYTEPTPKAG